MATVWTQFFRVVSVYALCSVETSAIGRMLGCRCFYVLCYRLSMLGGLPMSPYGVVSQLWELRRPSTSTTGDVVVA